MSAGSRRQCGCSLRSGIAKRHRIARFGTDSVGRECSLRRLVIVPHQLLFDVVHQYNTSALDISLPIELRMGQRRVTIPDVKLDTGASFCIFQREYGEVLGLDVESGVQEKVWTATGF